MDHAAAGRFRDLKTPSRGSTKAFGHLAPQRSQFSASGYDMAQTMLPQGQGAMSPHWARADDCPSGTVCHPGPVAPPVLAEARPTLCSPSSCMCIPY